MNHVDRAQTYRIGQIEAGSEEVALLERKSLLSFPTPGHTTGWRAQPYMTLLRQGRLGRPWE